MSNISVIIVTHNEAESLDRCLTSLKGFSDDITVVDLESNDQTKDVIKKHKANLISHKRVEIVEEIRQSSLKYAAHDYVLVIDPDEQLPQSLQTILQQVAKDGEYAGVEIPRKNFVFGKWIKHSRWWPDHQIRFVQKSKVSWPKYIHAKPDVKGDILELEPKEKYALIHENYTSISDYLNRSFRYAESEASDAITQGKPITLQHTMKRSVSEFVSRFFFDQGYKDGMHGFVLAFLQLIYYYLVLFFYWEKNQYKSLASENELVSHPKEFFRHGYKESLHWTSKIGKSSLKDKIIRKVI